MIIHSKENGKIEEKEMTTFLKAIKIIEKENKKNRKNALKEASRSTTVSYDYVRIRACPSVSCDQVGTYYYGDVITYDTVLKSDDRTWLSYIASSGKRRYVCAKDNDGSKYVNPCPLFEWNG